MASKYYAVAGDEKIDHFERRCSDESLSSTLLAEEDQALPSFKGRLLHTPAWIWAVHGFLLCLSFTMLFCSFFIQPSTVAYVREFSSYCKSLRHSGQFQTNHCIAPAAPAVEYQDVMFDGEMGAGSIYVGTGPEVDEAWSNITSAGMSNLFRFKTRSNNPTVGDQMVSAAELRKLDKPDTVIQVTDPKTGEQGYRVGLEVFHQLHCLNLLRQATYRDYYDPLGGDFAESPDKIRMHLGMAFIQPLKSFR
jgi:hypothetical protein